MTPFEAAAAYNQLLRLGGLMPVHLHRAQQIAEVQAFLDWCVEADVDPQLYMRARLEAINYKSRIAISRLASTGFLAKYKAFGEQQQEARQAQEEASDAATDTGNVAHRYAERLRAAHGEAGDRERCRLDHMTWYTAKSAWCISCPLGEFCGAEKVER